MEEGVASLCCGEKVVRNTTRDPVVDKTEEDRHGNNASPNNRTSESRKDPKRTIPARTAWTSTAARNKSQIPSTAFRVAIQKGKTMVLLFRFFDGLICDSRNQIERAMAMALRGREIHKDARNGKARIGVRPQCPDS